MMFKKLVKNKNSWQWRLAESIDAVLILMFMFAVLMTYLFACSIISYGIELKLEQTQCVVSK